MPTLIKKIATNINNPDTAIAVAYSRLLVNFSYYAKKWPNPELDSSETTHQFFEIYKKNKNDELISFITMQGAIGAFGTKGLNIQNENAVKFLKDEDPKVRSEAAKALGKIGLAAVPALIITLKDENSHVRSGAADALAGIGRAAAPAVPALIIALKDKNSFVRSDAADALGNIGLADAPTVLALITESRTEHIDNGTNAKEALKKIWPVIAPAVPDLITALKDEDSEIRMNAAVALANIGPAGAPAVPAFITALSDKDSNVREIAAWALDSIGPTDGFSENAIRSLMQASKELGGIAHPIALALKNNVGKYPSLKSSAVACILGICKSNPYDQKILPDSASASLPCDFTSEFETPLVNGLSQASLILTSQPVQFRIEYTDSITTITTPSLLSLPLTSIELEKILELKPGELSGKESYPLSKIQTYDLLEALGKKSLVLQSCNIKTTGEISLELLSSSVQEKISDTPADLKNKNPEKAGSPSAEKTSAESPERPK